MKSVVQKIGRITVGAAFCAAILAPTAASAGSVTQLRYLQSLVVLTGDAGQFNIGSTAADYSQWAVNRGILPTGGWNASAKLSSDVVAQSLVQLYGLNPRKYGGDYYRILEREGIVIDRGTTVSGESLAALLDNPVVGLKAFQVAGADTSPRKPGNGNGFGFGWYVHNGVPLPDGFPPLPPGLQKKQQNPGRGNR
jgi:hypothetical protein